MDDLDRLLSSEEPLVPSSGFTARVMDAVHDSNAPLKTTPFPWVQFAVGALASGVCAGSAAFVMQRAVPIEAWSGTTVEVSSATIAVVALLVGTAPLYARRLLSRN